MKYNLTPAERREVYLKFAEIIANNITADYFICVLFDLEQYWHRSEFVEFLMFEPTERIFEGGGWFSESRKGAPLYTEDNTEGNEHRVIALLLCAEMCE